MITNLLDSDYAESNDRDNSTTKNSTATKTTIPNSSSHAETKPAIFKDSSLGDRVTSYWRQMSLRRKATLFAVAISIIPMAAVGGIAHQLASHSLSKQIISDQESRTLDLAQKVSLFTNRVVSDANAVSSSPLLADPQIKEITTEKQKTAFLNDFIANHTLENYDSVAVFDTDGNLMLQSQSSEPIAAQENYSNYDYFQRAISLKTPVVNDPEIHSSLNKSNLVVAAPILDPQTNKVLGVVRLQMPLKNWKEIFKYVQAEGWEYKLIDSDRYIFDTDESEFVNAPVGEDIENFVKLQTKIDTKRNSQNGESVLIATDILIDKKIDDSQSDRTEILTSLAPITNISGVKSPGWEITLSRPVSDAFAPLRQLRITLLLGTGLTALIIGAIAATVTRRAILPIIQAAGAVEKIGQGELGTKLEIQGADEIAVLGTNINKMAKKLRTFVQYQAEETERSKRLKELTLKLSRVSNSQDLFQIALKEIILALKVERAIVYRLEKNGVGKIIAESTMGRSASFLKESNTNLEYIDQLFTDNKSNKVQVISSIDVINLEENHLQQLEKYSVLAELIAPFYAGEDCQSQKLLIVQQCSKSRIWQKVEVDFFTQLTSQVVLASERTKVLQQQKNAKEELQRQALSLLMEVDPISQGDLTIRATVTEGEIGTLADSYNSTVESLREIVLQVKKSTTQITVSSSNSEEFAQSLAERATQQSKAIAAALEQIQAMAKSVQAVAINTEEVETTFQEVLKTVATGDVAMDRTVAGIMDIRQTVAETAKKVKRLGESSQKISKVVNLIGGFAAQTNILALNASLEASRVGEEEHNFATVADEIRILAQQSAEATTEIEKIVASIQLDTKEVFKAMEEGIERVVIGTKLVDETRQSLNQVAISSQKVNSRIAEIAQETVQESEASQKITQTIAEVASMANTTSTDAKLVSASTKELLAVAEDLQASVSRFKA
ncbi:MAG: HAMP domain-containing protein [Pleurocapsa sp. SU_5_0]|nr:HAMP domain-containing protein [Pleurocapsa sp. SU_5_0]NJR45759.1 HAMP domain-containing protein [Hyellaceae cyanobacterium CSU_1_1]